jgi:hypothetical protein
LVCALDRYGTVRQRHGTGTVWCWNGMQTSGTGHGTRDSVVIDADSETETWNRDSVVLDRHLNSGARDSETETWAEPCDVI